MEMELCEFDLNVLTMSSWAWVWGGNTQYAMRNMQASMVEKTRKPGEKYLRTCSSKILPTASPLLNLILVYDKITPSAPSLNFISNPLTFLEIWC